MPMLLLQFLGRGRAFIPLLKMLAIVVGIALVYNSIRGMAQGEGMYNEESRTQMTIAGWVGIAVGIGLTVWGLTLFVSFG